MSRDRIDRFASARGEAIRAGRTALLVALAGFVLAGLGLTTAAVGADDPTPLEVFLKYRKERDPKLRRNAVAQLKGVRGAEVVSALLGALGDPDARVRDRAAALLCVGRGRQDELARLESEGLRLKDERQRLTVVRALGASGGAAAPALCTALGDRRPGVRAAALLALSRVGADDCLEHVEPRLDDRDPLVRAAAAATLGGALGPDAAPRLAAFLERERAAEPWVASAQALGRFARAESLETLARGLAAESWSVRVACARALGRFWRSAATARAAAAALVGALRREQRTRVRHELAGALFALTGIDFGAEPDRWSAWYADVGDTFEPPKQPPKRAGAGGHGATRGHLLDLPIESDHVCFVLDNSHSMNDAIRFGVETTKQDALVGAFGGVVERLPAGSRMNLIPFGTEPMPYKPSLYRASRGARRASVRYLERRVPDGRTNLFDALELALADPDVDTVVAVTDGAPSEGKRTTRGGILAGVRELNRYRLARIHAVEVGAQNTGARWRGFLRELADLTGGHYLER